MTGIKDAQPAGERSQHREPTSPGGTLNVFRLLRPFRRQSYRVEPSHFTPQELDEPVERVGGLLQLSAQRSSHGDVLGEMVLQRFHRAPLFAARLIHEELKSPDFLALWARIAGRQ